MAQDETLHAPRVFDYVDYRTFLDHWFQHKKRLNPRFSHRLFARLVGTTNPSVLSHVLAKRRELPRARVLEFCRAMQLTEPETAYFTQLVRLAQAADAEERRQAWAAMAVVRDHQTEANLDPGSEALRSSLLVAVLSLAECPAFRPDPAWVAAAMEPPIEIDEAREALDALRRAGLLVETLWGLRPSDVTRRTEAETPLRIDRRYHVDNHELAGRALKRMYSDDPDHSRETVFLGFSVAVPAERITEFRAVLWRLQLDAYHAAEALGRKVTADGSVQPPGSPSPDADTVYHVNVQAFPVTRRIG